MQSLLYKGFRLHDILMATLVSESVRKRMTYNYHYAKHLKVTVNIQDQCRYQQRKTIFLKIIVIRINGTRIILQNIYCHGTAT